MMVPDDPNHTLHFRRALRQKLESLERAGLSHWKKAPLVPRVDSVFTSAVPNSNRPGPEVSLAQTRPVPQATPTISRPPRPVDAAPSVEPESDMKKTRPAVTPTAAVGSPTDKLASKTVAAKKISAAARPAALEIIRKEVAKCKLCKELCDARTNTVFGVGDPNTRLLFIGEAPGADEDEQGVPFVGRAGQLLTDMIVKGMKLRREDVYILNVLKCRPPGNRPPEADEVANCIGFLQRQIDIIRPEFICCLGTTAAQSLLKSQVTIGRLRGRFHAYQDSQVICTYHPSYLLRNPSAKKDVWEDLQVLMKRMGLET